MKLNRDVLILTRDRAWFVIQRAIWPLIRDTTCAYCIFLRGALYGGGIVIILYLLWRMAYGP